MKNVISGRILLPILFFTVLATTKAQQKFIIKGKIDGVVKTMMLRLSYNITTKSVKKDSTITTDGSFILEGDIDKPVKAFLSLGSVEPEPPNVLREPMLAKNFQSFYLTGGVTTITGKDITLAIIKNPVQNEYAELKDKLKPINELLYANNLSAYRAFRNKDTDSLRDLKLQKAALSKKLHQVTANFVKEHPSSYVSFDIARENSIVIADPYAFEDLFNPLSADFKEGEEGKNMATALAMAKKFAIGQPSINFSQGDESGKNVSLQSFKAMVW
jgi:hypothetical protein